MNKLLKILKIIYRIIRNCCTLIGAGFMLIVITSMFTPNNNYKPWRYDPKSSW